MVNRRENENRKSKQSHSSKDQSRRIPTGGSSKVQILPDIKELNKILIQQRKEFDEI